MKRRHFFKSLVALAAAPKILANVKPESIKSDWMSGGKHKFPTEDFETTFGTLTITPCGNAWLMVDTTGTVGMAGTKCNETYKVKSWNPKNQSTKKS